MYCIDAQHGFTQIGMQFIEDRFTQASWAIPDYTGNFATYSIAFFSNDDLERLLELLGVSLD